MKVIDMNRHEGNETPLFGRSVSNYPEGQMVRAWFFWPFALWRQSRWTDKWHLEWHYQLRSLG